MGTKAGLWRINASDGTDVSSNPYQSTNAISQAISSQDWTTIGQGTQDTWAAPVVAGGYFASGFHKDRTSPTGFSTGLILYKLAGGAQTNVPDVLAAGGLVYGTDYYKSTVTGLATDGTNVFGTVLYQAPGATSGGTIAAFKVVPSTLSLAWLNPIVGGVGAASGTSGIFWVNSVAPAPSPSYLSPRPALAVYGGGFGQGAQLNPDTGAPLTPQAPWDRNNQTSAKSNNGAGASTGPSGADYNNGTTITWTVEGDASLWFVGVGPNGSYGSGGARVGSVLKNTNYNRAVTLVGVAAGTVKVLYLKTWQPTTNGTSALSTTASVVRSAPNGGNLYFADGVNWKYYHPATNAVLPWVASAGILPVDAAGNKPRLICTWRGRTVLAGLQLDEQNWFMSAVNDPTNFAYNPSPALETQAVAGNNSPAGLVGDIVTALIPYNDDVLIFGGDSTIYQMTGDPAAGGRIDRLSDVTGIAWGNAWCRTPDGTLYFFSSRGSVYSIAPGAVPQRVSQQIDQQLFLLDQSAVVVRMTYDERWRGLNVFVTPLDGSAATHYYYDEQAQSWWSDQYANNEFNPLAVLAFEGDLPGDRVTLMGGQDGWVRAPDPDADDDDGTVISSDVLCGPVTYRGGMAMLLTELQGDMALTGGSADWQVLPGASAQTAVAAGAAYSGTFLPGRGRSQFTRSAGVAFYVSLARAVSEPIWSVESLRGVIRPLSQTRQRQF